MDTTSSSPEVSLESFAEFEALQQAIAALEMHFDDLSEQGQVSRRDAEALLKLSVALPMGCGLESYTQQPSPTNFVATTESILGTIARGIKNLILAAVRLILKILNAIREFLFGTAKRRRNNETQLGNAVAVLSAAERLGARVKLDGIQHVEFQKLEDRQKEIVESYTRTYSELTHEILNPTKFSEGVRQLVLYLPTHVSMLHHKFSRLESILTSEDQPQPGRDLARIHSEMASHMRVLARPMRLHPTDRIAAAAGLTLKPDRNGNVSFMSVVNAFNEELQIKQASQHPAPPELGKTAQLIASTRTKILNPFLVGTESWTPKLKAAEQRLDVLQRIKITETASQDLGRALNEVMSAFVEETAAVSRFLAIASKCEGEQGAFSRHCWAFAKNEFDMLCIAAVTTQDTQILHLVRTLQDELKRKLVRFI